MGNIQRPNSMLFWKRKYNTDELQRFYRNEIVNTESMLLSDMWAMTQEEQEKVHNYIQWLLPTDQNSDFNRRAPVLTKNDIDKLKSDFVVMDNLLKNVHSFLDFLGLDLLDDNNIQRKNDFEQRSEHWLRPRNHNYKRITRCLTFLRLFGFHDVADNLMMCLDELYRDYPDAIGQATYQYWQNAAFRPESQ